MVVVDPIPHADLLWVFVVLALLLVTARALGELSVRAGLPSVVGELAAGILLGPSVLNAMQTVAALIFGSGADLAPKFHLVEVVAWLGLIMLIVLTGLETDLDLIVSEARTATYVSVTSIVVPFAVGFAFAWYLPDRFVAAEGSRLVFSLFVAVAMSISAIPVIAKILMDMGHIRRDFGQISLAAGMINDTVGWIMLALVAGLARTGEVDVSATLTTVVALAAFLGLGLTLGARVVRRLFVWVDNAIGGQVSKITTLMVLALGVGSFTHYLHLEAVLGAFVVGILVGQVNRFDYATAHTFEILTISVFAPIFFATAGLRVDLGTLADPVVFAVAVGAIAIAVVGKFVGSYVGAVAAGRSHWEGLTLGAGLNARGAMEIIVAIVGLSLGVLTVEMYSIVVLIAVVTSMMAPPLLRATIPRVELSPEERERLEREERLRGSFLGNITRILMPTRGGPDTQYAARLLASLARGREIEITNLFVARADAVSPPDSTFAALRRRLPGRGVRESANPGESEEADRAFDLVGTNLDLPDGEVRSIVRTARNGVSDAIVSEAAADYDLLVLGETSRPAAPHEPLFSETVDRVIQDTPCPVMIVSTGVEAEPGERIDPAPLDRILLPTVGTEYNRHAAEVAAAIAADRNAVLEIVHVVNRPQIEERFIDEPDLTQARQFATEIVDREAELAREMGARVVTNVLVGDEPEAELVEVAETDEVDLIVLGSEMRPVTRRAFFGHRVEHVIRNAPCPVAVVSSR